MLWKESFLELDSLGVWCALLLSGRRQVEEELIEWCNESTTMDLLRYCSYKLLILALLLIGWGVMLAFKWYLCQSCQYDCAKYDFLFYFF